MTTPKGSPTLFERQGRGGFVGLPVMSKVQSNGRFALRRRVNQLLAERGAEVRIAEARSAVEREMLDDYFLVRYPDRHLIVRDHVDLYEFAREIGALESGAC